MDTATVETTAPSAAPAAPTHHVPLVVVGNSSASPFPMFDHVWEIFSGKGIRTVFYSIGASASCMPDLDIAESLGCPLNIVALTGSERAAWEEVSAILKERARTEPNASHPFSVGAESKWVLPKNVRVQPSLPWWSKGSIDISGENFTDSVATTTVEDAVKAACAPMKMRDGAHRIDILKIDTVSSAPGLERGILPAIMNGGYRPAIILVHWSKRPNEDVPTSLAAGHLQNCGYTLIKTNDNKFLYFFIDKEMYQTCSWENEKVENPLVHEIMTAVYKGVMQSIRPPSNEDSSEPSK